MKIGFISSITKPTNLQSHGGQEIWATNFLNEEIKRGNSFDLYAAKGSISYPGSINLIEVLDSSMDEIKKTDLIEKSQDKTKDLYKFAYCIWTKIALLLKQKEEEYDFVIDSSGMQVYDTNWNLYAKPLIVVGHFPVEASYVRFFSYFKFPKNVFFVFPSRHQLMLASVVPEENKFLVPHGINLEEMDFQTNPSHDLVWVGRLDPRMPKGAIEAIETAKKVKKKLGLFAYIEDQKYFDEEISPRLSDLTVIMKEEEKKCKIFNNSKIFLFPIRWEEPFGLVMVEAMACGTPVVVFARGAAPEIVADGVTGFVVNPSDNDTRGNFIIKKTGIEGLCEAIERIYAMSPEEYGKMRLACRMRVEENFTVEKMVDGYENIYKKILGV